MNVNQFCLNQAHKAVNIYHDTQIHIYNITILTTRMRTHTYTLLQVDASLDYQCEKRSVSVNETQAFQLNRTTVFMIAFHEKVICNKCLDDPCL